MIANPVSGKYLGLSSYSAENENEKINTYSSTKFLLPQENHALLFQATGDQSSVKTQ